MLIACDFDGTITVRDCLNLLVKHFAPEAWEQIEPHLRRGDISLVEALVCEFRQMRISEKDALDYVLAGTEIRPGFAEFAGWCEEEHYNLIIVSAGFRVLIDPILRAAKLDHLPVYAGDARFSLEGTNIFYPPSPRHCVLRCGMCKVDAVDKVASAIGPESRPLVVIGDGMSDLCVARRADVVFARAGLACLLGQEALPFIPFEDFYEIRSALERQLKARG